VRTAATNRGANPARVVRRPSQRGPTDCDCGARPGEVGRTIGDTPGKVGRMIADTPGQMGRMMGQWVRRWVRWVVAAVMRAARAGTSRMAWRGKVTEMAATGRPVWSKEAVATEAKPSVMWPSSYA
jgi:hypothetical protein